MADHSKLEIVFSNLLTNAINYSPDGSRILVRIREPVDDQLVISVIDEGIGITEQHVDKIFDRFYMADTSDERRVDGYGLGLYISKCLVELQGGHIWVESKERQGSCLCLALPIVKETGIVQGEHLRTAFES